MVSTEEGARNKVVPFGAAPAAACTPSSPGRFSTRTGWPSARDRPSLITRAARSGTLPGASVAIIRSGRAGQGACAAAGRARGGARGGGGGEAGRGGGGGGGGGGKRRTGGKAQKNMRVIQCKD